MPGTTTNGAPYGVLGDPIPDLLSERPLAEWIDDQIFGAAGLRAGIEDVFANDATLALTGADVRAPISATTTLLTVAITLDRARPVLLAAGARFLNSGAAQGLVGICITIDGVFDTDLTSGPDQCNDTGATRVTLTIPARVRVLAAGVHTFRLQADRDANGVLDAAGSTGFNGRTYKPTQLCVAY